LVENRDDNLRGSDPLFPITAQPWFAVHLSVFFFSFCYFLFFLNSLSSVQRASERGKKTKDFLQERKTKPKLLGAKIHSNGLLAQELKATKDLEHHNSHQI
jgi:hypothetical protein